MSHLEINGLCKRFGGVQAVDDVAFGVDCGEILGLIGPNGSGKSTTLSLCMGVIRPDAGSVRLAGTEIAGQPTHAIAKSRMAMVFQHSRPLRRQTVLENIKLALLPDTIFQLFTHARVEHQAREAAQRAGLQDVLHKRPDGLPFAALRRLEVAKVLAARPSTILFDEPFAGLAPRETQEFAALIASLRDAGCAIILVDHNVKAVAGLVDRLVVMHSGARIAEGTPDEITRDANVRSVYFGNSLDVLDDHSQPTSAASDQRLLEVAVESVHYGQARALHDIQLHVNDGEFVSVVGLNGAGKTTLFDNIMGFVGYQGDIRWQGETLRGRKPAAIAKGGIALCPETRELFGHMSVRENLELGGHALNAKARREQLSQLMELFPRLSERAHQSAETLSGGEQQMLTIGRALMSKPRLLLLDEPTLGLAPLVLDSISAALDTLKHETGLTVLLAEQNLTFAVRHSQRVYVLETGALIWQGEANRFLAEAGDDMLL